MIGVSTLITLGVLEIATRIIYAGEYRNYYQHRVNQPEPYQDSDYFSKAFIQESIFDQPGKWINKEGTRIIYPTNFKGEYFNVTNHLRVTTNSPDSFQYRIHVLGGSTIYNAEVPDKHTVTSYLQRKVNEKFPNRYRIINYGVTSINTAQQVERLKMIDLQPQDKVVFYGGVNDGLLFTTGRIDGWIMGENHIAYNKSNLNVVQKLRFKIFHRLHRKSHFVEKFLNPYAASIPQHLSDTARVDKMKMQLSDSYQNSITHADSICKNENVTFYNFLQPTILTRKNRTTYENELLENQHLIPRVWLLSLEHSYQVLPEAQVALQQQGILSKDSRNILDYSTESHFLDYCHITDKGNNIVATEIFDFIFKDSIH